MLTATFAIKHKTPKSVLPPYYKTSDSAGDYSKSGVTLDLDHIYLLSLLNLFALNYGSLFGFESSTRILDTLYVSSNTLWKLCGVYQHGLNNSYVSATYLWVPAAFDLIKENTGPLSDVMKH